MRVRCPNCETEQEVESAAESRSCIGCGKPLAAAADAPTRAAPAAPREASLGTRLSESILTLASKPEERETPQLEELTAAERRMIALAACVPIWGPWKVWQSDLFAPSEKRRLIFGSLVLTAAIVLAVRAVMPEPVDEVAVRREDARKEIFALAPLVESYKKEYGKYPDVEAWERATDRSDRRFLDPWTRSYEYALEGDGFTIGSLGRDGQPGGTGEDEDVVVRFSSPESRGAPAKAETDQ